MSDLEMNGIVPDEESQDSSTSKSSPAEEGVDTSNNSVVAKTPGGNAKGKSQKGTKRDSARRKQAIRQKEYLDRQKQNGYSIDGRTKTFLDHLFRPTLDGRDVKSKVFKNQLMLSENLDEVPAGFAKNWMMLVCPVGSRCLVVANKGHTGAYTKSGYHIISHPSSLPMGNMMFCDGMSGPCVLDCIYCNEMDTYFVLDLMCWNGQPLYDCDTQMRQKLLHDKVREFNLSRPSHLNPYPIVALKGFTPTKSNICGAVREVPFMIDGLLFLHKQLSYQAGANPLCLWLTPDKLPLKMKIEIPDLGIVASHSYSDPVSLALAHGISPGIISQVYPSPGGPFNQRHGFRQQNSGPHQFHQQPQQQQQHHHHHHHHNHPQQHQYQHQQQHRHQNHHQHQFQRGWSNRGAAANPNGMAYLADMMAGMNMGFPHSNNHSHFGMNNSNVRMAKGGRFHQDHFQYGRRNGSGRNDFFYKMQEKKNKKKAARPQKNSNWDEPHGVMKSQWIGKEKPENFEENYLTCVCPMSKRRIIVATKGRTCTYNKYGKLVDAFTSSLPNGSKETAGDEDSDLTILDSLWCGSSQKFLVIDVMHWKQQSFYDCQADYRFSWLAEHFSDASLKSGQREYPIELVTKQASDETSISNMLSDIDFKVDGLLCFQKVSTYSKNAGVNALWLKLDMMQAFLGYEPPASVTSKPTTEKERKQRDYFIGLGAKKEENADGEKAENEDKGKEDDFEDAGETEC